MLHDGVMFFDWRLLYQSVKGDKKKLVQTVKNKLLKPHYYKVPDGYSFLANPVILMESSKRNTVNEVYDYIRLASIRNFFDAEFNRDLTLSLLYVPKDVEVRNNRLLIVKENKVFFRYEKGLSTWD